MGSPSFSRAVCLSSFLAIASAAVVVAPARLAQAQGAADKSTARDLAIEGIKEYGEGKHAEALSKLERAQSLYDAHVHLVYIARCQAALGKLVEASETYRALARKPLPPDASEAVRNAQEQGAAEFEALEPRIPRLRIDVTPADAPELRLSVDGQAVSVAVLGLERATNPGERVIRAGARGYKTTEAKLNLAEGAKQAVTLALEAGEGGPPVVEGEAPTSDAGGIVVAPGEAGAAVGETATPAPRPVSFVIDARLGVLGGIGTLGERSTREVVAGGGGGEARFGVHFKRRFTGLVMIGMNGLYPQSGFEEEYAFTAFDDPSTLTFDESEAIASGSTDTVFLIDAGVGFMVSSPHHQYGWFAEIDLVGEFMGGSTEIVIKDSYRDASLNAEGLEFQDCRVDTFFGGAGVRLSGGGVIPVGKLFHVTPYATLAAAQFGTVTLSGDCEQQQTLTNDTVHGWAGVGVGGQFLFGE